MNLSDKIKLEYNARLKRFENAKDEALYIIDSFITKSEIKIHSIQSRIKDVDSLIKKSEGLEIEESNKVFEEIRDIVGLRVICLFISDINEIDAQIKKHFDVIYEDNKLNGSEISSFGYFSVHFICKLKKEYKGPRYDDIKELVFEIQVRTISMDAWANISHYLDYKSEVEIPKDLKKDFFALSGLFYVADTHFEMFFKNKRERLQVAKKNLDKNLEYEINFETTEAYINKRFKKRKDPTPVGISLLIQELNLAGYKTIKSLDDKLNLAFKKISEDTFPVFLNKVGIVRRVLVNFDPTYKKAYAEITNQRNEKK